MNNKQKIIQAGRERNIIFIKAIKKDGSMTERKCEPYSFRKRSTGEIFHFFCLKRNDWRSLRLNSLLEVRILDEKFTPRAEVEF